MEAGVRQTPKGKPWQSPCQGEPGEQCQAACYLHVLEQAAGMGSFPPLELPWGMRSQFTAPTPPKQVEMK